MPRSSFVSKVLFLALPCALLAPFLGSPADASEGTARPPCGQTAWVGAASPSTVVHPGAGQAIQVPLHLVPYVLFDPALGSCATPVAATLSVQLKCNPDDGSASVFVGPTLVPIATPTTPGPQDLLTGPGSTPEFGGPFLFPIDADVLAPDIRWRCTVSATYTLTFIGGTGNGVITVLRQTVTCIVPPSPADATRPRLEVIHLDGGSGALVSSRRGDPVPHRFAVVNNDGDVGADLTFSARTFQIARLPTGSNGDDTLFSLAAPEIDRDAFAAGYADLLDQGTFVPEVDPTAPFETAIERPLHLGPGDVAVVTVLVRSHGAASDGACSGLTADAAGTFEDGTPALAGASSLQWVDEAATPTAPQHEVTDTLLVANGVDAVWSAATYDGVPARRTHGPGNRVEDGGTRTVGTSLGENAAFPETAVDRLRTETAADRVTYSVLARNVLADEPQQTNDVVVTRLATATMPLDVRVFAKIGASGELDLFLDAESGIARLFDRGLKKKKQLVYDGAWSILVANPPSGYQTLTGTMRSFLLEDDTATPLVSTRPEAFAGTFAPATTPPDPEVVVNDPRSFDAPLAWTAASDGPAVTPNAASGTDADVPSFTLATASMAAFPDLTVTNVSLDSAGAVGGPVRVPFVTRTFAGAAAAEPLVVTQLSGKVSFTKDGKDKLVLRGSVPVEEGFDPQGETVTIAIDSLHVAFTLDGKGKAKSGKHTFELALKKKKGSVPAGDVAFTLRLKKADLSGLLSRHHLRPDAPEATPLESSLPVTSWWFHGEQTRVTTLTLTSVVGGTSGSFTGTQDV